MGPLLEKQGRVTKIWILDHNYNLSALQPLEGFDCGDVVLTSELHKEQLEQTHSVLMGLSDDSLPTPLRQMSKQPAPGEDLGGLGGREAVFFPAEFQWVTLREATELGGYEARAARQSPA